jgi:hypothetical protein
MDIKELDKKQLILLTLLITFVVSIATGIVTVSLMKQMPKSVPQTINNVIQRTIEKVTTVQAPAPTTNTKSDTTTKDDSTSLISGNSDALVSIYLKTPSTTTPTVPATTTPTTTPPTNITNSTTPADTSGATTSTDTGAIGQGVIVSDIGLILVDSSLIKDGESYKVVLNKIDFDATVLKKFDNGFTILKISPVAGSTPPATTNTDDQTE